MRSDLLPTLLRNDLRIDALPAPAPTTPFANLPDHSEAAFQEFGTGYFPGLLGLEVVSVESHRDAIITDEQTGRRRAMFRCTQTMVRDRR